MGCHWQRSRSLKNDSKEDEPILSTKIPISVTFVHMLCKKKKYFGEHKKNLCSLELHLFVFSPGLFVCVCSCLRTRAHTHCTVELLHTGNWPRGDHMHNSVYFFQGPCILWAQFQNLIHAPGWAWVALEICSSSLISNQKDWWLLLLLPRFFSFKLLSLPFYLKNKNKTFLTQTLRLLEHEIHMGEFWLWWLAWLDPGPPPGFFQSVHMGLFHILARKCSQGVVGNILASLPGLMPPPAPTPSLLSHSSSVQLFFPLCALTSSSSREGHPIFPKCSLALSGWHQRFVAKGSL